MNDTNMVDWDYWPYIWLKFLEGQVCIRDHNGWYLFTGAKTLGM